jgi:hypothetical protein
MFIDIAVGESARVRRGVRAVVVSMSTMRLAVGALKRTYSRSGESSSESERELYLI